MWIFKTKDDDLIYVENTSKTKVLGATSDGKVILEDFEEGKAHQLWKKGELDAEDYFTLENAAVPKVLTAISDSSLEIKGNIIMRWILLVDYLLIIYHVVVLHTDQLNTGEGFTIFATCSNEWCLQKGLQKPQHKNSSSNSEKWCEQSGGVYVSHVTFGTRTNYAVCGCKYYDDPGNWHWCDLRDGYWYNHSLDYYETSNKFITSITCTNWIKICDFKS